MKTKQHSGMQGQDLPVSQTSESDWNEIHQFAPLLQSILASQEKPKLSCMVEGVKYLIEVLEQGQEFTPSTCNLIIFHIKKIIQGQYITPQDGITSEIFYQAIAQGTSVLEMLGKVL